MATAIGAVLDVFEDFPHLPELPARGPASDMIGRGLAVVAGLGAQWEAGEWRLAPAAGADQRLARSVLRDDLDRLEEAAHDFQGRFKVQVCGPWTLAAVVSAGRSAKVLGDGGARRDLAQALAEGVKAHLGEVAKRLPGAALVLQVDEPALPSVLRGGVPTPGGYFRYGAVDLPEAVGAQAEVAAAARAEGAQAAIHCCAPGMPFAELAAEPSSRSPFEAVSFDLDMLADGDFDALARAAENGAELWLGVLPTTGGQLPSPDELRARTLRFLDDIGVRPDSLVLTPACGLASLSAGRARQAMTALAKTVAILDDQV
jgi:methionine synthase II (cobalamin-independent)